jgi:hypothetical protein
LGVRANTITIFCPPKVLEMRQMRLSVPITGPYIFSFGGDSGGDLTNVQLILYGIVAMNPLCTVNIC